MDYEIPDSIQKIRVEEMQRIETLIKHQMDFLSANLTVEQRIARMRDLSELDKAKLLQLESSLKMSEDESFNRDSYRLFDADKKFLASFTSEEIKNFLEFQCALSPQNERKKGR